jgi:DNA-binding MarR family transcriptional regulator
MNMKLPDKGNMEIHRTHKDGESYHTLQILDELAKGNPLTQRDLSSKLGIALGMINSYLKRLARQGYIQIVQAEGKRLHYFLTPMGIAQKSALTYRYIKKSYYAFTDARERMTRFLSDLEKEGVKSVVLYKASVVAEIAMLVLQDSPLHLVAVVDEAKKGGRFLGYRVRSLDDLRSLEFDRLLLTTEDPVEEVSEHLVQYGLKKEIICSLR